MLRVCVISLFPEMFRAITDSGITRRALEEGLAEIAVLNPRNFTDDKHQTVDDRPYGGGPGMVMRVEPLKKAVDAAQMSLKLEREQTLRIYLSPQGRRLDKNGIVDLGLELASAGAARKALILICGRYEGVDERFIEAEVDAEWSIGDYVLSGGELPAMVLLDALIRKLPAALGDEQSAEQDSFENGLLDCPHYTRPEKLGSEGEGSVPEVLLSGDHKRIADWRLQQSLVRTWQRRPDLIEELKAKGEFGPELQRLLQAGLQNI